MSTTLLRMTARSCRMAIRRPTTVAVTAHVRFASTPATEPGKKAAPHDGIPFAAPPRDDTKGQLGQVFLPDMNSIEYVAEAPMKIPGEPDNYSLQASDPSLDSFPLLQEPKVFTVTSPETYPGGGPESAALREDPPVVGEVGDGVPASQQVSEPLTADERKGLLVLGGIVLGGLLLGSLGNRKMVTKVEVKE